MAKLFRPARGLPWKVVSSLPLQKSQWNVGAGQGVEECAASYWAGRADLKRELYNLKAQIHTDAPLCQTLLIHRRVHGLVLHGPLPNTVGPWTRAQRTPRKTSYACGAFGPSSLSSIYISLQTAPAWKPPPFKQLPLGPRDAHMVMQSHLRGTDLERC